MWGKLIHGISRDLAPLLLPFVGRRMESTKVDGLTKLQKKKKEKKAIYYNYHLTRDDTTKRRKISRNRDREKLVTRKICEEKFERG